ncbi:MAG: hypothetical protein PHN45_00005 [Methylococcales bacterium]|nr:hypothetical protein [Methylococcales bacterium]
MESEKASSDRRVALDTKIEKYKTATNNVLYTLLVKKGFPYEQTHHGVDEYLNLLTNHILATYIEYGLEFLDMVSNQYNDEKYNYFMHIPNVSFAASDVPSSIYPTQPTFISLIPSTPHGNLDCKNAFDYLADYLMPSIAAIIPFCPPNVSCVHKAILSHNMAVCTMYFVFVVSIHDKLLNDASLYSISSTMKYNPQIRVIQSNTGNITVNGDILSSLEEKIHTNIQDVNSDLRNCNVGLSIVYAQPQRLEDVPFITDMQAHARSDEYEKSFLESFNDMHPEKYLFYDEQHPCTNKHCAVLSVHRNDNVLAYVSYCPYTVYTIDGSFDNYIAIEEIRYEAAVADEDAFLMLEHMLIFIIMNAASSIDKIHYAVMNVITESSQHGRWFRRDEGIAPVAKPRPARASQADYSLSHLLGFHYTFGDIYNSAPFTATGSRTVPHYSAIRSYNYLADLKSQQCKDALTRFKSNIRACTIPIPENPEALLI